MNKIFLILPVLIIALIGAVFISRNKVSFSQSTRQDYSSENLQQFQGVWHSTPTDEARGITAEFKGRSLRLVASSEWRKTYSIESFTLSNGNKLIVVDEGSDALVYRFGGDDVLWIELKQTGQEIRFERVVQPD